MSRRRQKNEEHVGEVRVPEEIVKGVADLPASDSSIHSFNAFQVSPDTSEIWISGKSVLRQITIEFMGEPRQPKGPYSTLFSQPVQKVWKPPYVCFRLGFCSGELRPHFEVLLDGESRTIEVFADKLLTPGERVHLAGTFDGSRLCLYVNSRLAAEREASGVLANPRDAATPVFGNRCSTDLGDGYSGLLHYLRVWRIARSRSELEVMMNVCAPPPHPDPNAPNPGDDKTLLDLSCLADDPDCILWWPVILGPYGAAGRPLADKGEVALATRILTASGVPLSEQGDATTRRKRATQTILACCDELETLVNDLDISEPDVLSYFEEHPHASFLIEPDQDGEMWREQEIQGYGRIDFVFRKTNGRYVAVEIESPAARLFRQDDEFCKQFDHAIDQVERWQLGALKHQDLAEHVLGMTNIQSPDGMVVMGRSRDLNNPQRNERWNEKCARSSLALLTWDDLLNRGRSLGRRLNDPALPDAEWA